MVWELATSSLSEVSRTGLMKFVIRLRWWIGDQCIFFLNLDDISLEKVASSADR